MLLENESLLPREKVEQFGVSCLENWELFAVILGSGVKGCSVFELSQMIVSWVKEQNDIPCLKELCGFPGIGLGKACQILSILELSQRMLINARGKIIKNGRDIAILFPELKQAKQEHFSMLTLDNKNQVIRKLNLTKGLVNQTPIHPREAFREAVLDNAVSVAFVHNHPAGSLEPSPQDLSVTQRLVESGQLLGIKVLDHIIVSIRGWASVMH